MKQLLALATHEFQYSLIFKTWLIKRKQLSKKGLPDHSGRPFSSWIQRRLHALKNRRNALAATDAHGHQR
ncbi:MAG: hypothetical protein LBJ15_06840, partial [Comamonas sp.]|uniref:hypothetical protein n=1 Tax=Comamonas sp. TaxID=34028 RepID=UPI0028294D15